MFSWEDIRQLRKAKTAMYAFLNDAERQVSADVVDALRSYEIVPVLWSARTNHVDDLAA
jgi:hypothetical protein